MIKITESERIAVQKNVKGAKLVRAGAKGRGKGTYYMMSDDYRSIKYVARMRGVRFDELKRA